MNAPGTTLSEDALGAYLDLTGRRRARGARLLVLVLGLMLACVPLAWCGFMLTLDALLHLCGGGGLESWTGGPMDTCVFGSPLESLAWSAGAGGVATLFLLPTVVIMVQAFMAGRALGNLRRTGALEELASTQLTPARMVDGLALHAATQASRSLWAPVLLSCLFLLVAGPAGPSFAWALLPLAASALWFPLLVANELWLGRQGRGAAASWTVRLPILLALAAPLLLVGSAVALATLQGGPWQGAAAAFLGSLPLAALYRWVAIQGLQDGSPLRRCQRSLESGLAARRSQSHRDATANALLFRERAVRSGGSLGAAVRDHGFTLAVALGILALASCGEAWLSGVPAVALMLLVSTNAAFRALLSSSRALQTERQQRTLEVLQQSGVSARDFVQGWSTAVASAGRTDILLVFGAGLVAALARGEFTLVAGLLPLGAGALAACHSAASWGVAYAGAARTRFDVLPITITFTSVSGLAMGLALLGLAVPVGVALCLLQDAEGWPVVLSAAAGLAVFAGTLAAGALGHYSAVKALIHRPDRTGFTA